MEEPINHQPLKYFFIILNAGLLSFSGVALASTESMQIQPEFSIVHQNYAANNSFVFNPRSLQWKAINSKGKVVRSGKGSGGRGYCPDIKRSCRTPSGTYSVISKSGPSCRSSRYPVGKGGAPMPYCMFFSRYYAIHGSPDVPNHNASHGCIRVVPSDARWLNQNFIQIGTKVVVKPY